MTFSGFAQHFVKHKNIEASVMQAFMDQAEQNKTSLILCLAQQKGFSAAEVARLVSDYFALPLLDLSAFDMHFVPQEFMNLPAVQKRQALPLLKKDRTLLLAIPDPTLATLNDIPFMTGFKPHWVIVSYEQLQQALDSQSSGQLFSDLGDVGSEKLDEINISAYADEDDQETDTTDAAVDHAPVVRYINKILLDAVNKGASDIHFEPYENYYRIRFRQDGVLQKIATPPTKLANYLVARIKVMSNLNTAERRVPQDGRFKLTLAKGRSVDFRISICPTLFGEKVVMRLLAPAQALPNLNALGMSDAQRAHFADALEHSQGMILVSGPTGSGKTVTLYTALNILNTGEENISTVEDPVEIPVAGINQVHVNNKTGMTFSVALRSFLRQDPDVIMVGEIRDLETAEIAVKAAQTGHLVLSTVHTNSAVETITRLASMGIPPYNLASSLLLIIAQRLARRLCAHCKKPLPLPPENSLLKEGFTPEEIKTLTIYDAEGCERCHKGYKGRVGIFEVLPVSPDMVELILAGAAAPKLAAQAKKEGVMNLRESGLAQVKAGVTSLTELNRVFKG